jgi:glucokinase
MPRGRVMSAPGERDGFIIGVDVGGTKVAAGLVEPTGAIARHARVPMVGDGSPQEGFAAVKAAVDAVLEPGSARPVRGIGICSPGPLDPHTGVVINPPNLPCWRNFPLASEMARIYGLPVRLDNDANAAGLAEALWGAGAGYRNVFYTTIGTGIGTGVIVDQRVYHGRTGAAGEGGHMSIDYRGPLCGCGKRGCIESLASGPAITRRTQSKLQEMRKRGSLLWEMAAGHPETLTSEMVGRADAAGDALAHEVLLETIVVLSVWLGNIVDLLEPDVIIMGGGVAAVFQPYLDDIRAQVADTCVNSRAQEIPLLAARYGADSGIAGGAALCVRSHASKISSESPSANVSI